MKMFRMNLLKKILLSIFIIMAISLLFFSYYTFAFVVLGVLPTIVTIIVNKQANIYAINTLVAVNLTALLPFIFQLFNAPDIHDMSKILMYSSHVWFIIYSIIGFGYFIILTLPHFCGRSFVLIAKNRIISLEQRKKNILSEWNFKENDNHIESLE